jgi:hypothetical protein
MLINLDFFDVSVGYFHAFCLDLFAQNTDHIALAVFRILLSPLNSGRWISPRGQTAHGTDPVNFMTPGAKQADQVE